MRLDHLLSKETVAGNHVSVVVEDGGRSAYGNFCCLIFRDQKRSLTRGEPMDGGVAQLGEHLPCKQGVMGSIPIISTTGQCPDPTVGGSECHAVLRTSRISF